ncbi:LOW QUALITY PROTEIN: relaxin-3 receptor 2-like [Scyliorhinus canicula]|uniref:LOW QUALITY PROTEIN: relaxin-3 receptor 2-like n=1 Tax=Scyliorhinus canicula TaxID=7830 RepID=UPI0018F4D546|nr:LOW QUALITY PROTEIN: relaxin-3 receptor 2-like [Scyliorhinus canicula]
MDAEQTPDSVNGSSLPSLVVTAASPGDWAGGGERALAAAPPRCLHVMVVSAYVVTCVLGLPGNLLVLCHARALSGQGDSTITHPAFQLALADLQLVLVLPFWAAEIALGHVWPFGNAACKLAIYVTVLNAYTSAFFLTAVCVSRYCAAARPRRPGGAPCRHWTVRWISLAIWLVAGAASVPPAVYSGTVQFQREELCLKRFPRGGYWLEIYQVQRILVTFVAPLAIVLLSDVLLRRLRSPRAPTSSTSLVNVLVVSFTLCWLPNHAITLWGGVLVQLDLARWARAHCVAYAQPFTICLANANGCLNPVIYCLMWEQFREGLKGLLRRGLLPGFPGRPLPWGPGCRAARWAARPRAMPRATRRHPPTPLQAQKIE